MQIHLSFAKMHALAIYNFKNWELTFSLSSSSFKLELGLWDSIESRLTERKNTKENVRSDRVYARRGYALRTAGRKEGFHVQGKSHYANDST